MIKRLFIAVVVLIVIAALLVWLRIQYAPLDAIVRGGNGPPTLVLLHGYGSRAEEWLQFDGKIQVPNNGRLVFPQGPIRVPFNGARGWWWLNIEGHIPEGHRLPDFSTARPTGIKVAARLVRAYMNGVAGPIVLGGFSQGAMLSAEIAFQTDQEIAALVLLSGTTVNEAAWVGRMAARRRIPVFIAHGRSDGVLPFDTSQRFQEQMKRAGLNVTWVPFDGGHDVPAEVVSALNRFLSEFGVETPK